MDDFIFPNIAYFRLKLNSMKKTIPKWVLIVYNLIFSYVLASAILQLIIFVLTSRFAIPKQRVISLNPIGITLTFVFILLLLLCLKMFSITLPRIFKRLQKSRVS
jgi:glycerol uptake facilitator-like aquaporin